MPSLLESHVSSELDFEARLRGLVGAFLICDDEAMGVGSGDSRGNSWTFLRPNGDEHGVRGESSEPSSPETAMG